MIALLGLAQIPLGLTLYGSPLVLFVLYALAAFALLVIYFLLEYVQERHYDSEYDSRYSYGTGSVVEERRRHSRTGDLLKAGAAGAGLAALANRLRNRSRSRDRVERPEVVGSRRHSGSFIEDEKYYEDEERGGGWRDRLLKLGAVGGAAVAAKSFFDRRRNRDRDSDTGDYGPPLGGEVPVNRRSSLSRINEGAPVPAGQHPLNQPLNQPLNHRRSTSSMTYSSYMSASQEGRNHGVRDAVAGLGAFGLARNIFKKRRERKEQKRLDQQIERERLDRERNQRLTGDGTPRRQRRRGSVATSTDLTESTDPFPGRGPILGNPRPMPAGVYPATAAPAIIPPPGAQASNLPPPPPHGINPTASNPVMSGAAPVQQASMPPIPPDPQGILHQNYSGSESSASNQQRPGREAAAAALAGAAVGGLAAGGASRQRDRSRHQSGSGGSVASPPVSVKVKMHSDGRHVTLRRLPDEEAAATREARRKDRSSRRRRGSGSDLSGTEGASARRWRRTEALERQQQQQQEAAEQARQENERLLAQQQQQQQQQQQNQPPSQQYLQPPFPQPPPIPESSPPGGRRLTTPGAGSVGSPGTDYGNTTDASAHYASTRKRRRAERAQDKAAREEGRAGGGKVEFT